jgi:hypothetical protein
MEKAKLCAITSRKERRIRVSTLKLEQTICLIMVLLLAGCGSESTEQPRTQTSIPPTNTTIPPTTTPTPIPPTDTPATVPSITEEDSKNLHEKWEFASLLYGYGEIRWDADGKITIDGDIAVDFAVRNPPGMTFVDESGGGYFEFDKAPPRGSSSAVVIFTTPEAGNGHARIPRFTPMEMDTDESATSYFAAERFHDYDGTYDFWIGLVLQGFGNIMVVDSNIFLDGSEHFIYGEVELFGVEFKNDSGEPLIFEIVDGKYVHVKGSGTATTKDGSVIQFSE